MGSKTEKISILFAFLAAVLYALNSPVSKLLLDNVPSTLLAALLYLGAGAGTSLMSLSRHGKTAEVRLSRSDFPFVLGMILLDIAAPILLLLGLKLTSAENASLLNNFEIVVTSLIALVVFKEAISKRVWLAIAFITASGFILCFEDIGSLSISPGSLYILGACVCWGFENNCTRKISGKDPLQITAVKGVFSGTGSLIIALILNQRVGAWYYIPTALVLGFVSYGLSIYFYIKAQRTLGAAKTSAYYAVSPFVGVLLSLIIFRQLPQPSFFAALLLMLTGAYLCSFEKGALAALLKYFYRIFFSKSI